VSNTDQRLRELLAKREELRATDPTLFWAKKANPSQLAFHQSQAWMRYLIGGNKSGKTDANVAEGCYWLDHTHPWRKTPERPIRIRYCALDFNKIEEVIIPKFRKKLPPALIDTRRGANGYNADKHILYVRCKFDPAWDHEVHMLSYEQAMHKAEGGEFDVVIEDEPSPKSFHDANLVQLLARGGCLWGALTPLEDEIPWDVSWIFTDIVSKADGKKIAVWTVDTEENRHNLDPTVYEELTRNLTDEQKDVRLRGHFAFLRGLVYKEFTTATHLCDSFDVRERVLKGYGLVWVGLDHGDSKNTAALFLYVEGDGDGARAWAFGEYFDGQDRTISENSAEIVKRIGDTPVYGWIADPATWKPDPITKQRLADVYPFPMLPGDNDIPKGHDIVRQWMAVHPDRGPRLVFFRDECPETVGALLKYSWKPTRSRDDEPSTRPKVSQRHKHLPDCLRYLLTYPVTGARMTAAPLPDADPITGNPYSIPLPQHVRPVADQSDPAQASPLDFERVGVAGEEVY
jgi:hypothetical protein